MGVQKKILLMVLLVACMRVHAGRASPIDTNAIRSLFVEAMGLEGRDPDAAYQLARKGFVLSMKGNYTRGMGMGFMRFTSIFNIRGRYDSALFYGKEALRIRMLAGDHNAASAVCRELSYAYEGTGQRDSAFYYLYEALRLNKVAGDSSELGKTYLVLGNLCADYQLDGSTLSYLQTAERIFMTQEDVANLGAAWSGLGNYYFVHHRFAPALRYFLAVDSLEQLSENGIQVAKAKNNIALCYDEMKLYSLAERYFTESSALYARFDMKSSLALVYFNLGSHYIKTGKAEQALMWLNKSLGVAREINDLQRIALDYEFLSDAYALKGNYLDAYYSHVRFAALSDSLLNAKKITGIAEMQAKYETAKKEQQIALLDAQGKTHAAQRNFFIAGSIVLLLGLFVLGFYYVQRNRLARKNELIAKQEIEGLLNEQEIKTYNAMIDGQEEERKRIASDLHDRLGSMLSTVKLLFGALDSKIDKAQEAHVEQYAHVNKLLDEAVAEVRRVSHNLSTGMVMSFGLDGALEELCGEINNSGLIRVKLLVYGMKERLDPQVEIGLYRMVQELFSNILKHAKASEITVQVNRHEESLTLTVEDNGVGFDPAQKKKGSGMGLKNLEARAAKLHGAYQVDSRPGAGTISIIEIPNVKREA